MQTKKLMTLLFVGIFSFTACKKEEAHSGSKEAVVDITVLDDQGKPLAGVPVKFYDERTYAEFQKNNLTPPLSVEQTDGDGKATYRFLNSEWFRRGASREFFFVVQEGGGTENYRIWAATRTIAPSQRIRIRLQLKNLSEMPGMPGSPEEPETPEMPEQPGTPEMPEQPGTPEVPGTSAGEWLDMYDEQNGRTLFGEAVYIDAAHDFVGSNRYSFVDAGPAAGLEALGMLTLDRPAERIAVEPRHGYFICKDIALAQFPSGAWALAVSSEYARVYVSEWLVRDGREVGARIRSAIGQVQPEGLPAWGMHYELPAAGERSLRVALPGNSEESEFMALRSNYLQFVAGHDDVTIRINDPAAAPGKEYRARIRSGARYTEITLKLTR